MNVSRIGRKLLLVVLLRIYIGNALYILFGIMVGLTTTESILGAFLAATIVFLYNGFGTWVVWRPLPIYQHVVASPEGAFFSSGKRVTLLWPLFFVAVGRYCWRR